MNKQCGFHFLIPVIGLHIMVFTCVPVRADNNNWTDKIAIHGFITAAMQKTDQSNAAFNGKPTNGGITDDISTLGTRFGLNINAELTDRVSVVTQFTAERNEEYNMKLDWGFISVNLNENIDLRAGKIKFPGGLLSEYVDVGNAYPWIEPPQEMYSKFVGASQAVHDAFSGVSFLGVENFGDMTYSANLFAGEVVEDVVNRKNFSGLTLEADWDDKVLVQVTYNTSTMETGGLMPVMDGENHDIAQFGVKIDWNNVVVYSEYADVKMGDFKFGDATTSYITLGYRFGKWLPHFTISNLEKAQNETSGMIMPATGALLLPFEQTTTMLGLRWDFMESVSAKFEVSNIELDSIDPSVAGFAMFNAMPDDDSITRYGIAIDAVF